MASLRPDVIENMSTPKKIKDKYKPHLVTAFVELPFEKDGVMTICGLTYNGSTYNLIKKLEEAGFVPFHKLPKEYVNNSWVRQVMQMSMEEVATQLSEEEKGEEKNG